MIRSYKGRWLYFRIVELIFVILFVAIPSVFFKYNFAHTIEIILGGIIVWYLMSMYLPILVFLLIGWWKTGFENVNKRFNSEVGVFAAHSLITIALLGSGRGTELMIWPEAIAFWPLWLLLFLCQFFMFCWLEKQGPLKILKALLKPSKN